MKGDNKLSRYFDFARQMKNGCPVVDADDLVVLAYPEAQLPEYQTKYSAGADFFCAEEVTVPSIWKQLVGSIDIIASFLQMKEKQFCSDIKPTVVHTGIKANMEDDEVLYLFNRSSNPKKNGLILANSTGVVDRDYFSNPDNDGEIMFAFYNVKPWDVTIKVGDRIGQGVFQKYLRPSYNVRIKDQTRTGGFGSTNQH